MPEYVYLIIGVGIVLLFFAVIITGVIVQNIRRKKKWHEGLEDFGSSEGSGITYEENENDNLSDSRIHKDRFDGFGGGKFGGGGAGGNW